MQQGIKKLQWFKYSKVVFLEILNPLLCWVFANQVTYVIEGNLHLIIMYLTSSTNDSGGWLIH